MSAPTPPPESFTETRCVVCGGRITAGRPCAQCLLRLAVHHDGDTTDPLFETLRGQGFGDYQLIHEIARGGMGVVYRARQLSLGREVALKMIIAGELAGKKALRMFQTEAQAAANLHHPNIVPVYEIGEHEMQNYFTMRYVPGGRTIADWAVSHRDDPRAIAGAVAKVARAVAHAHERGVLHRDLKPSNVLWDLTGEPMVTDFGLAKLLDHVDPSHTYTGEIVGSPSYMAPEQVDHRAGGITTATDVYGLGALLYEMLSGRPPFNGGSALEIIRKVEQVSPRSLSDVPKDLHVICFKCLAKRPEDRYSTAVALAEDLERFVAGEPVSAVPLTAGQTFWRWVLRKPRSAALLGAFVASILFGMTGVIWQWRLAENASQAHMASLARLRWQEIGRRVQEGDIAEALTYLASLIRENAADWHAAMYAMSIIDQNSLAVLSGPSTTLPVASSAFAKLSPDGSWFVTAGKDEVIRVWDTPSGKELHQIPFPGRITGMATGKTLPLAITTESGDVVVFPTLTEAGKRLERFAKAPVFDLQFSADGNRLFACSASHVEVWTAQMPSAKAEVFSLGNDLQGIRISQDGTRFLAWSAKEAAVWDVNAEQRRLTVLANTSFRSGALSANGARVALIDDDYFAKIWDASSAKQISLIESPFSALTLAVFNSDGSRITFAGNTNDLMMHDTVSGLRVVTGKMEHHYQIKRLISNSAGTRIFSYGWDDRVNVWDASTGKSLMGPAWAGNNVSDQIGITPSLDGRMLLIHCQPKKGEAENVSVWEGSLTREPIRHRVEGQRDFYFGRLSPDYRLGCLGLYPENRCYIYELDTGRVILDKPVEGDLYVTLFSPDMTKCYGLTANGRLYGWSLETGESLWPPNQQPGKIRPAIISSDGTRIIVGHNDGYIRIYDSATGQVVKVLQHEGEIKTIRWAPDNSGRFLSGSTTGVAHVWDLNTGEKLQTFQGHKQTIIASAWSPDSQRVATASYDTTVRIWNVKTGWPVGSPLEHLAWLSHVEFSPDGRLIATACRDGTARLWHARTGQLAAPPLQQGSTCETVRFTADSAALLVRDHSGFRFWDTEKGEPLTIHYSEPAAGGMGMDSESYRAITVPDGTRVFLASSMNYGASWPIAQPRDPAPPWFADFIELLTGLRRDSDTSRGRISGGQLQQLRKRIEETTDQSIYARWARKILDMTDR